ncbi:MAG: ferric reductase-like transmembrane domain-containing protein, partial [Paracoccaceae bacterium]
MPASILICLYLFVALLPTGLAWAQGLPPRSIADELASGAGLVALSVLLAEFLLLGRVRLVTRRVGSDVVMRVHQLLARGALALAFVHPLLYQTRRYAPFEWDETRQMTVAYDFHGLWPGIAALLLLGAVVAMAINRASLGYRYEV